MSELVQLACRLTILLVFAAALLSKVRGRAAWNEFQNGLGQLGLLPGRSLKLAAWTIAVAEALTVVLLAVSAFQAVGLAIAVVLLPIFNAAIVLTLRLGTSARCPCFGGSGGDFGWSHVARNTILTIVAAAGLLLGPTPAQALPSVIIAATAALFLALVMIYFSEITDLFRDPVSQRRER